MRVRTFLRQCEVQGGGRRKDPLIFPRSEIIVLSLTALILLIIPFLQLFDLAVCSVVLLFCLGYFVFRLYSGAAVVVLPILLRKSFFIPGGRPTVTPWRPCGSNLQYPKIFSSFSLLRILASGIPARLESIFALHQLEAGTATWKRRSFSVPPILISLCFRGHPDGNLQLLITYAWTARFIIRSLLHFSPSLLFARHIMSSPRWRFTKLSVVSCRPLYLRLIPVWSLFALQRLPCSQRAGLS